METKPEKPENPEWDDLEQLIAEIVSNPEVRAEMEKIHPIDHEMN